MMKLILLMCLLLIGAPSFAVDFTVQTESMTCSGPYAGKITNPFEGVALYANNDAGTITQNITNMPGVFDVELRGASNNNNNATVSLLLDGTEIATFTYNSTAATTIRKSIELAGVAGSHELKLLMKTDNGGSDIYLDWLAFTKTGDIPPPPAPPVIPARGAVYTGNYRNMFLEAGYTQNQIDTKVNSVFQQLFYGTADQKVYYEKGVDEAYILDVNNNDVRSEGQSYGMMIAVQMNKQTEFDKLWKFAKTYMQHQSGYREGYFAWKCSGTGAKLDENTASDGEMYFVTALYFASVRFGDHGGIFNYRAEADEILTKIMNKGWPHNSIPGSVTNMFNPDKQICFVPYASSSEFTDPSYYLPGFLDVWAIMAKDNKDYWADAANVARDFLQIVAHPKTGLTPDYSNYNGTVRGSSETDKFSNDAMRVIMNVASDYSWFKKDEREKELCMRIQSFFKSQGIYTYVTKYELDGRPQSGSVDQAVSLMSCNAVGSLASTDAVAWEFIKALWDREPTTGRYRYYDGMLQMLSMLHLSGQYKAWVSSNATATSIKSDRSANSLSSITVSPNPTFNTITLSGLKDEIYSIQVFNTLGVLYLDRTIDGVSNNTLSLEDLPKGTYLVKIKNNDSQTTIKVVKK
ncbi:MAG: T9SS type A sorting domain-containing protein [Marinilabiliaceae bacterium]|nr:T9SS type A sorting domain-containing protein [Marinilabiliaceae bacterium]